MLHLMCVFGTRPEAIKMAPVIRQAEAAADRVKPVVCVTGQHREMLDQVLACFRIKPDIDLGVMRQNQTLALLTANLVQSLDEVMRERKPDLVLVQGDTTTAMIGALAAYYHKIPVGHVEAGLRTSDRYNPFPEEMNRRVVSELANLHFAPTQNAVDVLLAEGHPADSVFLTGNTVVDALLSTLQDLGLSPTVRPKASRRSILVTAHRRENFDAPLRNICSALRQLADRNPDVEIVYPVHLNPNVQQPVLSQLSGHERIRLLPPLGYAELVRVLHQSHLVLTDSGGIQEEAPALGIPVLVMRTTTERPEGITAGVAKLVGTETEDIVRHAELLLNDATEYARMARAVNPYGDGRAAEKILCAILSRF
jgi:UDP-N-acetylglucosamine 2-epimerase (non-hydrolysing)